ncbi:hypothetical protein LV84_01868 [Algoriphagus ratkowskyi]|uniref:Uncharacterized protein n=1 Tax=Algoriphagus ratkowskyi TaxID=57028 RepID=A0A2W7RT70_9BACT|nr:hypothetical protein [Algoriphagus ratkowskyi]PZX57739.1 hypothetical protein LV84_01868 [Algoriphagus ratkowskyi]TXD79006.1 hypothetical protein ESW18_05680 [Algoriphagus ratkowskyi]
MKKIILLILVLAVGILELKAQVTTVNLDLITSKINGGMPLPAEEEFYVRGAIPEKIEMVKLLIFPSNKTEKSGYTYFWKAPFGYKELSYQVLMSQPLRSNTDYHLEFGYYQKAGSDQISEVRNLIQQNIKTYLSTVTSIKRGGIKFSESDQILINNLSKIVEQGAFYFELPNGAKFPGFSDITRAKLEQRGRLKMGNAKFNVLGLRKEDNVRAVFANDYLTELEDILFSEVNQYLSPNMLVRVDETIFEKYATEKTDNSLPINIGYGAISLSNDLTDREYVTSPYVGLSFPLGNRTFARFMNNMSVSTGFFLSDKLENQLGETISGPVLDRPIYVGLGYNFFRFIRLNAGGTFITTEQLGGSKANSFQPFVGISAEFNIWMGIGSKKR